MAGTDAERRARAVLTGLTEPGDIGLWRVVDEHGAIDTLGMIADGRFPGRAAAGLRVRLDVAAPERALATAARVGGRLICPTDPEWPAEACELLANAVECHGLDKGAPPLALWLRGPLELGQVTAASCAVVGSRAATDYGTTVAAEIAAGVAERGFIVVSGAAYGIDAAAHAGAVAAGGRTVAVLACGVDQAYPRGHDRLLARVAKDGLLVSEVPPGTAPTRSRFLVRNRLIVALTLGTVVVEAALRSGALNTARWAEMCSRPLMGVPGPITSDRSAGVHQMLRQGATVVTAADEVAEQIAGYGEHLVGEGHGETRPRDELTDPEQRVLDAMPVSRPAGAGRIAVAAGVDPADVPALLGRLLAGGYVERNDSGWRLARTRRG